MIAARARCRWCSFLFGVLFYSVLFVKSTFGAQVRASSDRVLYCITFVVAARLATNGVLVRPQRFAYANARPGPEDLIVPALQNQKPV